MENLTLEREFLVRAMSHRYAILGAYYMKTYMQEQTKGTGIPEFMVEPLADKYSENKLQQAMADGSFLDKYEKAWKVLAPMLP